MKPSEFLPCTALGFLQSSHAFTSSTSSQAGRQQTSRQASKQVVYPFYAYHSKPWGPWHYKHSGDYCGSRLVVDTVSQLPDHTYGQALQSESSKDWVTALAVPWTVNLI